YYLDPNAGHTYSKPMRLAMYRWFNKWLKGVDDPAEAAEPKDPEDNLISRDSGLLRVLAPGERGKDVIDLEREYLARYRTQFNMPVDREEVSAFQAGLREKLIALMGDMPLAQSPVIASDDKVSGRGSTRHVVL